jgi:hypothetical protein
VLSIFCVEGDYLENLIAVDAVRMRHYYVGKPMYLVTLINIGPEQFTFVWTGEAATNDPQ